MIRNFSELNDYLQQFVPGSVKNGDFYKPDRMFKIMPLLGLPQEQLKVVHIAGTSGKTSTSYYIAAMLQKADAKVGLSVSPHILEVNERVQIDGKPMSEARMCELFNTFIATRGLLDLKPTYFELLVAFAFWAFVEEGCTHAVIEVGLGGLNDGTNIVGNPEKISVITDIGLDHTQILGETIEKITFQKAGIIQHHNHVFCYEQGSAVDEVIDQRAVQMHAIVHRCMQDDLAKSAHFLTSLPDFQKRNWLLAREVAEFVIARDELNLLSKKAQQETQATPIPARMQVLTIKNKTIVCDGAHNPQKLEAFITSLKAQYPQASFGLLIGFMESKQSTLSESLHLLKRVSNSVITTQFPGMKDLPYHVMSAENLAREAKKAGFETVSEASTSKALNLLLEQPADVLVITGSFYLVSRLLPQLQDLQSD